jgi:hypothetical protein
VAQILTLALLHVDGVVVHLTLVAVLALREMIHAMAVENGAIGSMYAKEVQQNPQRNLFHKMCTSSLMMCIKCNPHPKAFLWIWMSVHHVHHHPPTVSNFKLTVAVLAIPCTSQMSRKWTMFK